MDFLRWYKHTIESNKLDPPEGIWKNIQNELDIEDSWEVVNHHLKRQSRKRRISVLAIAASTLLIISIGTFWFFNPEKENSNMPSLAEYTVDPGEDEVSQTEPIVASDIGADEESGNEAEFIAREDRQPVVIQEIENIEGVDNKAKEENIPENLHHAVVYPKLNAKTPAWNSVLNSELIAHKSNRIDPGDENTEYKAFRKLYAGSTGQLANTWLLNDKTINGLESSSLTSTNTSFGSNFGVFIGTNLTRKINVQMDLNILVHNNQGYNEYLDGHYITNTLRFNYSHLALAFRYNFFSKQIFQGEHGVYVGGYTGYLHNAEQSLNGMSIDLSSQYNTFDYGIFMGYEYVFPIYGPIGLGTGFRLYYGLKNIYSGGESIPSYFNKTNNASANFTLSVKYQIK